MEYRKENIKIFDSEDEKAIKLQRHLIAEKIVSNLIRNSVPLKEIDNILVAGLRLNDDTKIIGYKKAFQRRNKRNSLGTCFLCGSNRNLEQHHIKHKAVYPELKYEQDNIMIVCKECHDILHYNSRKHFTNKLLKQIAIKM